MLAAEHGVGVRRPSRKQLRFSAAELLFLLVERNFPYTLLEQVVTINPLLRHLGPGNDQPRDVRDNMLFLEDALGFSQTDLHSIVKKYPLILIHRIDDMKQNVKFFRYVLCLDRNQLHKLGM